MTLETQLESGLRALGEEPERHPCDTYLAYLALLEKWNRSYNLSGIREQEKMLTHHVLDSLAVLPWLRGTRALDVGSGAGLPGFILALARPGMHWLLLDSSEKKTRFLRQALIELQAGNVEVSTTRIEQYRPALPFTTIISRALMAAGDFCKLTSDMLEPEGRIILMKGRDAESEIEGLDGEEFSVSCESLAVPGVDAERRLLLIETQH